MRRTVFFFLLCLLLMPAPLLPAADEESLPELAAANRLLRAELELARTNQLYFVFDLGAQPRVQFKGSGIAVAELPVQQARLWGRHLEAKVRTVAAKDTLFPPKRQKIVYSGTEKVEAGADGEKEEEKTSGPPDLQALELDDMPTSFHALLDDGIRLTVHPAPQTFSGRLLEFFRGVYWYLSRPLISDWHFLQGKPYTEVRLVLPAGDVRLLYWSLGEGASCLITGL